jgi:predicted restriction endonuclease
MVEHTEDKLLALPVVVKLRNQHEARQVANHAYPFHCCAVCGLQLKTSLQLAHLDQDATNNVANNLARLCPTHHGMYDAGLYPVEAIRLLQDHWQVTEGKADHKPRMKDAGAKAALTRKRTTTARKAVATRRANALRLPTV